MSVKSTTKCPQCQQSLSLPSALAGKSVKCPNCATTFKAGDSSAISLEVGSTETAKGEGSRNEKSTSQTSGADSNSFGRFQLQQILGQGAFGRVYQAYDRQLDRLVALKVPLFGPEDGKKIARFQTEAKAAARLRHPNIVPVLDSGVVDGKYFIATQFIEGQPLSSVVNKKLDCAQVARWGSAVASALAYAHNMGIVHRDVKPHNIMLDNRNEPQLMDFGLAKRVNDDSAMTTEGSLLGTPAYMSPEQARGDVAKIGPHSDQYAVGAVMYELLTSRRPFDGPPHAVLAMVLTKEPAAPRSIRADISRDLEAIVLKAMSKEPTKRYANCQLLAEDLERWLRSEPTLARPVSPLEKMTRWAQRNKAIAALSCSVAALAVIALIILTIGLISTNAAREQADKNFELAKQQTEAALNSEKNAKASEAQLKTTLVDLQTEKDRADTKSKESEAQRKVAEDAARRAEEAAKKAEEERSRAVAAEAEAAKQRDELLRKSYASTMVRMSENWNSGKDPFRFTRDLEKLKEDPTYESVKGLEFQFWNSVYNHYHFRLPGFSLPESEIGGFVTTSEGDRFILACTARRLWIWDFQTRKLLQAIDLTQVPNLPPPEGVTRSCHLVKGDGISFQVALNVYAYPSYSSLILELPSKTVIASFPDTFVKELPDVGLVKQTKVGDQWEYETLDGSLKLGAIPIASSKATFPLLMVDRSKKRKLVFVENSYQWRNLENDKVLSNYATSDALIPDMFSTPHRDLSVLVVGNLSSNVAFDIENMKTIEHPGTLGSAVRLNPWGPGFLVSDPLGARIYSSIKLTKEAEQNTPFHFVPFGLHATPSLFPSFSRDGRYLVQFARMPYGYPSYPIITRTSFDGLRSSHSMERKHPTLGSATVVGVPVKNTKENRVEVAYQTIIDEKYLEIRLESPKENQNEVVSRTTIDGVDFERGRVAILAGRKEAALVAADKKSIRFHQLGKENSAQLRMIELANPVVGLAFDPTERFVAVTYGLSYSDGKTGTLGLPVGTGQIDIFDVATCAKISSITYENYQVQTKLIFDITGSVLFKLGGVKLRGPNGTSEFLNTVGYDVATGQIALDLPPADKVSPTALVVADAKSKLIARGPVIHRFNGEFVSRVASEENVIGFTEDGTRALTTESLVDVATGEILMMYPETDVQTAFVFGSEFWFKKEAELVRWSLSR